jgi:hypothetical protein
MKTKSNCILLILLFSISCSSGTKNQSEYSQIDDDKIVNKINKYKDSDSHNVETLIIIGELIEDIKQQSISALKSKNSIRSLKYSSLGVKLFPFRQDLVEINEKALEAYEITTKQLLENSSVSCNEITNRIAFLKKVAPDVAIPINDRCKFENNIELSKFENIKLENFNEKLVLSPETENFNFDSELEIIINNQKKLPLMEVLLERIKLDTKEYTFASNYKIHPDTTDTNKVKICPENFTTKKHDYNGKYSLGATLTATILTAGIAAPFLLGGDSDYNKFCQNIKGILEIEGTSYKDFCEFKVSENNELVNFNTSKKIIENKKIIFNKDWTIKNKVFKATYTLKNGKKIEDFYLLNNNRTLKMNSFEEALKSKQWEYTGELKHHYNPTNKCQMDLPSEEAKNIESFYWRIDPVYTFNYNGFIWRKHLNEINKN